MGDDLSEFLEACGLVAGRFGCLLGYPFIAILAGAAGGILAKKPNPEKETADWHARLGARLQAALKEP